MCEELEEDAITSSATMSQQYSHVLFRGVELADRYRRPADVAGDSNCIARAPDQTWKLLVRDLIDLSTLLDEDELRAVFGRIVEARDHAVAIADFRSLLRRHFRVRHAAQAVADFAHESSLFRAGAARAQRDGGYGRG